METLQPVLLTNGMCEATVHVMFNIYIYNDYILIDTCTLPCG